MQIAHLCRVRYLFHMEGFDVTDSVVCVSRILLIRLFRYAQNPPSLTREGSQIRNFPAIDGKNCVILKFCKIFRPLIKRRV